MDRKDCYFTDKNTGKTVRIEMIDASVYDKLFQQAKKLENELADMKDARDLAMRTCAEYEIVIDRLKLFIKEHGLKK